MPKYNLLIQDILILYETFIIQPVQQLEYYSHHAPTKKKNERQEDGVSFSSGQQSVKLTVYMSNSVVTKLQKLENNRNDT